MKSSNPIPFNRPYLSGDEQKNISEAYVNGKLAGDGPFTQKCHNWIEAQTGCAKALLTHSCTAALEMAALLLNLKPGDEVIMPSFTFVSSANAFVLRGAIPVFVDIRPDTLNIDEKLIEAAITPRTRAIVPVHYAGVGCEMDTIMAIAKKHNLVVIEDAAQGVMAKYKGRALGAIGDIGAFSFHETKNIISGEGGCLLLKSSEYVKRAEIIREKGTDRSQFFRGEVDKYTWQDMGSSFLPGELIAAFLFAQMEAAYAITDRRMKIWQTYHARLEDFERREILRRPIIPADCQHNAHMYYVLLPSFEKRTQLLEAFRAEKIGAVFHYVPLHSSPAGQKFGRAHGNLANTDDLSRRLVRLPLWVGLEGEAQERVLACLTKCLES